MMTKDPNKRRLQARIVLAMELGRALGEINAAADMMDANDMAIDTDAEAYALTIETIDEINRVADKMEDLMDFGLLETMEGLRSLTTYTGTIPVFKLRYNLFGAVTYLDGEGETHTGELENSLAEAAETIARLIDRVAA